MDSTRVTALLTELQLKHSADQLEPDLTTFQITVDEEEGLELTGLHYQTDELEFLRLLLFVDELDAAAPLDQLRMVLALNGELPVGAYCLDPDEDILYVTVNMPLESLTAGELSANIEFLILALDIYDEETAPPDDAAGSNGNGAG